MPCPNHSDDYVCQHCANDPALSNKTRTFLPSLPQFESQTLDEKKVAYLHELAQTVIADRDLEMIVRALGQYSTPSQSALAHTGVEIVSTLLRKNADYGDTAGRSPLLAPDLSPCKALLVRMSDKVARLANLISHGEPSQVDESLRDTMRDLAGYAIRWLVANNTEIDNAAKDNSGPALR